MKDKIFMAFLCATLCVVTNAMGALGDGPGKCKVKERQEGVVRSANAQQCGTVGSISAWVEDAFIFIGDNEVLQCGGEDCGDGVEFKMRGHGYVYRCTVTGGTGEWKQVTSGSGIDFCEDSKIKKFGVIDAEYNVVNRGQGYKTFYGHAYIIDTEGFCVKSDCKEGYEPVDNKCQPKEQSANGGSDDSGASTDNSANGGSDDSGASTDNSANGSGDGSGASTDNSANGGSDDSGASTDNSANGSGNGDTVSTDNNEIETLGKLLDEETEKFERSKWRDAEGKFNTARLASDSIAGVVLGTAGGLISSKVIKKKQVENGFEDIKCTIGSQEVADWGDEFRVGIQ